MLPLAVHYLVLGFIIVAGSVLRLTGLNRQSLWFDEIDVVVRAQRPLSEVLDTFTAAGENGPVYNVFLWAWVRVAGISEIAVRFPSAIAGAIAIPLIYVLGRRVAGPTVGLVAAALLAINPYHHWYSQEAKMYAFVVVLAILSSIGLIEALNRNTWTHWIAYVAVTTLMFYTHVTTVLVFVAQVLFVLATWSSWRGRARNWLIAVAALTLPYIPIAIWAWRVIGGGARTWQPDVTLWEAVRIVGIKFAANRSEIVIEERSAIIYVALALLGAAALVARRRLNESGVLLLTLTVVPVLGIYLASLRNSVFSDRYVIVALPAYLILVVAGITILWRHRYLWAVGVVALLVIMSYGWATLRDVNLSHTAEKEDWRSAYALVADEAQPGDVIITHPGYILTTYQYYSQREPELQQYETVTIPTFQVRWLTEENMVEWITNRVGQPDRFWYVESPDRVLPEDPNRTLEAWLTANSDIVLEREFNGVRLILFDMD
jgi:mannosyltransferase